MKLSQRWKKRWAQGAHGLVHLTMGIVATVDLSIVLHMLYILSQENLADAPSRRLSSLDYTLALGIWNEVQMRFGGGQGHLCDLMALDSNAMSDRLGRPLPNFTPYSLPGSIWVNLFAQDLTQFSAVMQRPYVVPPNVLVGPGSRFLQSYRQSCTVVVLGYILEKVLVASFTTVCYKSAEAGSCRWFTSLVTTLKARLEQRKRDPRGLVGLRVFPLEFWACLRH